MNWKQTDVKPHKKPTNCEEKIGRNNCSDFVGIQISSLQILCMWRLKDVQSVQMRLWVRHEYCQTHTPSPVLYVLEPRGRPSRLRRSWVPGIQAPGELSRGPLASGREGNLEQLWTLLGNLRPPLPPPVPAWDVQLINWLDLSWSFSQVDWLIGFITKIDRSIHHRQIHELFD